MRQISPVFPTVGLMVLAAACDPTSDPVDPGGAAPTERVTVAAKDAFRIQDLGTLGGPEAIPSGINERTQVAGVSDISDVQFHAFLWTPGQGMQDLGTLGGSNSDVFADPNDRGDVAGVSQLEGDTEEHAFLWIEGRGTRDLGTLGGTFSLPFGLNNRRQVVGFSFTEAGRELPFLWEPGRGMRSIGTLNAPEDEADAYAINDASQVVGEVAIGGYASGPIFHPFLWSSLGGMQDLGNLGNPDFGSAYDINERGEVTGRSGDGIGVQAFLWRSGQAMEGLGRLGGNYSEGWSINVHRVVVGGSTTAEGGFLPFVWIRGIGMRALPIAEVGGVLGNAYGINDRNEISGEVFLADGNERAVLWRPRVDLLTVSLDQTPGELFEVAAVGPPRSVAADRCHHARKGLQPFARRTPRRGLATSRACAVP